MKIMSPDRQLISTAGKLGIKNVLSRGHLLLCLTVLGPHLGPPDIVRPPENIARHEGEDAEFFCEYFSVVEARLRWFKHYMVNGSYWNENSNAYVRVIKVGKRYSALVLLAILLTQAINCW